MENKFRYINFSLFILIITFALFTYGFVFLNVFMPSNEAFFNYYTDSYGLMAFVGGIFGLYIATNFWGGFRSLIGKSLSLFSVGLIFQFLGQVSYGLYYYVFSIDNPYGTFGEIFYFGSLPIYILAVYFLAKAFGFRFTVKALFTEIYILVVPVVMLFFAYFMFLRFNEPEIDNLLITFLDYGYPVAQSLLVSTALVTFISAKKTLGGVLKFHVLTILVALIFQYLADTTYLHHTYLDTWRPGGLDDLLFVISYFLMGLSLVYFGYGAQKLTKEVKV